MKANTVKLVIQPRLRFHEIVRRKNNPNKETLIYIPYSSRCRNLNVYNPNCKTTQQIINSTLLLLLVRPIYLDMCPSIPIHIHPYMSIPRLLLETDDETMVCLQWVPYILETTTQDVPMLTRNLPPGKQKVGLILFPFRKELALPSEHLEGLR